MKVAVLVHNDVLSDARVRKQVQTLVRAGMIVDVYGLTADKSSSDYPRTIEGCRAFHIREYARLKSSSLFRDAVKQISLSAEALVVAVGLLIVSNVVSGLQSQIAVTAVVAACCLATLIANVAISVRRPRRRLIIGVVQVISAAIFTWFLYDGRLSQGTYILAGLVLWLAGRVNLTNGGRASVEQKLYSWADKRIRPQIRNRRYWYLASVLADAVGDQKYDVIHSHDVVALLAGDVLKKRNPAAKLIWDAHEIYEDLAQEDAISGLYIRKLIRSVESSVDKFITINDSIAAVYKELYRLPDAAVIMNATVKSSLVSYDGRLHRAAGLNSDRKILLYQGGFSQRRGLNALCGAAGKLPDPWSLVLMGWGAMEADLRMIAAEVNKDLVPGQHKMVVIPPAPHPELMEWTAGGTIGAIPYEDFGKNHLFCTPNKLWEFPNAGVPILATDMVEMGEMIRRWGTGFLVPRDVRSWDIVDFLNRVTDEEIEEKRKNCRAFAQHMSWDRFEPVLLGIYRDLGFDPVSDVTVSGKVEAVQ